MTIEFEDVFPILADAIPEFKPSAEDLEDRLSYLFLNDMARWVCDRGYPGFENQMGQFAALFEKLISEGDSNVHDLAHDALETVWEGDEREFVARHFGPKTRELWDRICAGERE
jgi:hypothetical protein